MGTEAVGSFELGAGMKRGDGHSRMICSGLTRAEGDVAAGCV